MILSLAINFILAALKEAIKNPKKKTELKKVMLQVYIAIKTVYFDDPDFG